jgi:hypothetical protein
VLVESLIVIGMITIFLACAILLHGAYIQKLAVMRESRGEALMLGGRGCGGGLTGGLIASLASVLTAFESTPVHEGSPGFSVGAETSSKTRSTTAPTLVGGRSFALTSESRVACNEQVLGNEYIGALFEWLFNEITPDF